jgi:Flagellar biosynthesis protein, FliO
VWTTERENIGAQVMTARRTWKAVWERAVSFWKSVKIGRKTHALHLEETLALGERRMLAIVEWKGEKLLLGVTPQQITLLEPRGNAQTTEGGLQDGTRHQ